MYEAVRLVVCQSKKKKKSKEMYKAFFWKKEMGTFWIVEIWLF